MSGAARYGAVFAFIGAWVALGAVLGLSPDAYLLLGVPFTLAFQIVLRKRPALSLWVRSAPPARLRPWLWVAVTLLALLPLANMVVAIDEQDWPGMLFGAVSLLGAFGVGYSLQHFRREDWRTLAVCLLATSALDAIQWFVFFRFGVVDYRTPEGGLAAQIGVGVASLFQYAAVVFVVEEVAFRMLDTHLQEGEKGRSYVSPVIISVLWALWHLPGQELTPATIGVLLYVHVPYGFVLSLCWRKSGNLLVPGLAHALGDSVRNALLAGN